MNDVLVWRICLARHAETALSGAGARLHGGRWSFPGTPMVYTSGSVALCALEILAHVDSPIRISGVDRVRIGMTVPAGLIEKPPRFPESWRKFPHSTETQRFGTIWSRESRTLAMQVPSALVPSECNFLINPLHPRFDEIKISPPEPFQFDPRLQ